VLGGCVVASTGMMLRRVEYLVESSAPGSQGVAIPQGPRARVESPTAGLRELHRRRLQVADFDDQVLLDRATIFVCGPAGSWPT